MKQLSTNINDKFIQNMDSFYPNSLKKDKRSKNRKKNNLLF